MNRPYRIAMTLLALLFVMAPLTAVMAQGGEEITLVPFESEGFGLMGVVPEGWTMAAPGVYTRNAAPGDLTSLIQQAAPGATVDQVTASLLPSLGLAALPEPVSTIETDDYTWTVYDITVNAAAMTIKVDLAITETDGGVVVALLQALEADYEPLHEAVFLPAVNTLAPLVKEAAEVPYMEVEVTFDNGDHTLAGTLTLPEGDSPFTALILLTGSGPQDRDESLVPVAEIKPFRLIADYLTREGFAVLRYDDRGVGESTGDYSTATTADLATDGEAAIAYLLTRDDIDPARIGLLGHSEGGVMAPMIAARNEDVAFVVSLAGTSVPGYDVLTMQNELIMRAAGATEEEIDEQVAFSREMMDLIVAEKWEEVDTLIYDKILSDLQSLPEDQQAGYGDLEETARDITDQQTAALNTWYRYFIMYNPGEDWAQVTVPVLALFGGLDTQVEAAQNGDALDAIMADSGNEDYTRVDFEKANHLFQEAETGSLQEYGSLKQEFVPDLLPTITDWLRARFS